MFDPRYKNASIFDRRGTEWTIENVQGYIEQLFKNIEILPGWKYDNCQLVPCKKSKKEELKRHIVNILKISISNPSGKQFSYDIQVPKLIENQFFYIGGHYKIPIFQLYDHPIIYKNSFVKLRTNTITLTINLNSNEDELFVTIFNKIVPLKYLIATCHSKEEWKNFISSLNNMDLKLLNLSNSCYEIWNSTTEYERIESLGKYFSSTNSDKFKKGRGVKFSLNLAYSIDFFSRKFFKTNSVLFELVNAIHEGLRSDTDIKYKRIRFVEYILSPLIKKMYDLLLTLYTSNKAKFRIQQTILLDNCNVSNIVHFNFPINPIQEIASLCQATLTGPGGFKKNNVPSHLRNLDESQFGVICPADTPDRDGCGVVLNMPPVVKIKSDGNFGEKNIEIPTSYPISLIPFCEHDDQVRLQMASNQLKQSIFLQNSEHAMIRSGVEKCYLEHSTFLYKAKYNGQVIHIDNNELMIVKYDNKISQAFKLSYRSLYLNNIDLIKTNLKEGNKFKKGDILCYSKMIKNGELSIGQNLLTSIAVWKGYNYEDAIIINENVTKKKFTSSHSIDLTINIEPGQVLLGLKTNNYNHLYKPLPEIGDCLKKGDIYAKIKTLETGEGNIEDINIEPRESIIPLDCTITKIEIFPNVWNTQVPGFDNFIKSMMDTQSNKCSIIEKKLRDYMNNEEVEKFMIIHGISKLNCRKQQGKYFIKSKKVGGIVIKIQAVYEEELGIGDKLANRHGNKGVISKIVSADKMPKIGYKKIIDSNGKETYASERTVDIILNPLGIISRMNVGQLYELQLNEIIYQIKIKLKSMNTHIQKIKYLGGFLDIVDKTPDKWITKRILTEYKINLEKNIDAEDKLYIIQPPFQSVGPEDLLFKCVSYILNQRRQEIIERIILKEMPKNILSSINDKDNEEELDKFVARIITIICKNDLKLDDLKIVEITEKLKKKEINYKELANFFKSIEQYLDAVTILKLMVISGTSFFKYKIFDPTNKQWIKNPITIGYMYFLKLVHRATSKMSARSIGPYSKKTLQPLGGKSKQGGHRLGEMEIWSLMAHGTMDLLKDFLTVQSDSPGLKNKFLANTLQNPELAQTNSYDDKPRSLRIFEANLKVLGINIKDKGDDL